jgi:hypothetical protein
VAPTVNLRRGRQRQLGLEQLRLEAGHLDLDANAVEELLKLVEILEQRVAADAELPGGALAAELASKGRAVSSSAPPYTCASARL